MAAAAAARACRALAARRGAFRAPRGFGLGSPAERLAASEAHAKLWRRLAAGARLWDSAAGAQSLLPRAAGVEGEPAGRLSGAAAAPLPALLARDEQRSEPRVRWWDYAVVAALLLAPACASCAPLCCCQDPDPARPGEWVDCTRRTKTTWYGPVEGIGGACDWHKVFVSGGDKASQATRARVGFGKGWERCIQLGGLRVPPPRSWIEPEAADAPVEAGDGPRCCCQDPGPAPGEWVDCGRRSVRQWVGAEEGIGGPCEWHKSFVGGKSTSTNKAAKARPGFSAGDWKACEALGGIRIPEPRTWLDPNRAPKAADGPTAPVLNPFGRVLVEATKRKFAEYRKPFDAARAQRARDDGLAALGDAAAAEGVPLRHPLLVQASAMRTSAYLAKAGMLAYGGVAEGSHLAIELDVRVRPHFRGPAIAVIQRQPLTGVPSAKLGRKPGEPMDTGRLRTNLWEKLWCFATTSWRGVDRDTHNRGGRGAFRTQRAGTRIFFGNSGGDAKETKGHNDALTSSQGGTLCDREEGDAWKGKWTVSYVLMGEGSAQGRLNVRDTSGPRDDVAPGNGYIIGVVEVDSMEDLVDVVGTRAGLPLRVVMDMVLLGHRSGQHESHDLETAVFQEGRFVRRAPTGALTPVCWSAEKIRAVYDSMVELNAIDAQKEHADWVRDQHRLGWYGAGDAAQRALAWVRSVFSKEGGDGTRGVVAYAGAGAAAAAAPPADAAPVAKRQRRK